MLELTEATEAGKAARQWNLKIIDAWKELEKWLERMPAQTRISAAALLVTNLIPLAGVLASWLDAASTLLIYWAESSVIWFYAVLKIIFSQDPEYKTHFIISAFAKLFTILVS